MLGIVLFANGCVVYLSGSMEDYNYWAELVGDDSWKWENSHRRLKEVSLGVFYPA